MGVRRGRGISWSGVLAAGLLAAGLSAGLPVPAEADGSSEAGVQEYLIPGTQAQLLGVFNRLLADIYGTGNACVSTAAGDCVSAAGELATAIESRVSVVAYADRSVLLLDAAANGFQGGYDPEAFDDAYDLDRGQVITFAQDGTADRAGYPPPALSAFPLLGGDRLVTVGGPVLVMRAAWPRWIRFPAEEGFGVSVGRILAESLTLYPTGAWGSGYGSPMGVPHAEDPWHVDDRTTLALVQASEDATVVAVDGAPVGTLPRGGALLIDPVPVGAFISGSGPIAVSLVTSGGEQVDVRAFNLTPPGLLDSAYVLPANSTVAGDDRALELRLYLYAYEPLDYGVYQGSHQVAGGTLGGAGATAVHAIGGATEVPLPEAAPDPGPENSPPLGGGLRVEASGRLQVLAAFDSDRPDWDWGFPLVGAGHLANEYFVPWAPGRGPAWPNTNVGGYLGFGNPLHLSPAADRTRVFVDWDPWLGNGAEQSVVLDPGEWATLVDPVDGDNTGARLFGVRVAGGSEEDRVGPSDGPPEAAFAVAWGEGILADLADGYDLGYGLLPSKEGFFEEPLLDLVKVVEPERVSPGDEIYVTLSLTTAAEGVTELSVTDALPGDDFHYVEGSTSIHYPDGTVVSGAGADPVSADGLTLVWELGGELAPGSQLILTFRVAVAGEYSRPLPDTQVNTAEARGEWCPFESRPCFELRPTAFDNVRVDHRTGTIKICKKVKWRGALPDESQTFTVCVRPLGGGEERCQEVDWDGGTLVFREVPAGQWEVYEKDVDEATWAVTVAPEVVEVHGRCGAAWAQVVNRHRHGAGTLDVKKVVDWRGAPLDPEMTFTLCVRGPTYPGPSLDNGGCQQVGAEGGVLSWDGLERGHYTVYEDPLPGPEWRVTGSGQRVWVGRGRHSAHGGSRCSHGSVVIKNIRRKVWTGKVVVKKRIDWNGFTPEPASFEICLVGPSPQTTARCQTIEGSGPLVFADLPVGSYVVTEDPGPGWEVAISGSPVEVRRQRRHRTAHARVTNRRVEAGGGALDVLKQVDWNGETPQDVGFSICITGPSFPTAPGSCQAVSFATGDLVDGMGQQTLSWSGLAAGEYAIGESPGPEWGVVVAPASVTVTDGETASGRVENTRRRGRLEVTKSLDLGGQPNPGQPFEICITGPAPSDSRQCQTIGPEGGTLAFEDLVAGSYTVTETPPVFGWSVSLEPADGQVVVPAGGTGSAGVTNRWARGSLVVTKVVDWSGVTPIDPAPEFTVCITGPNDVLDPVPGAALDPYPGDCQVTTGGPLVWSEIAAADYVIQEYGFGPEWAVAGIPGQVQVGDGETETWTITNTYRPGHVFVEKVTVPAGDPTSFDFAASWLDGGFSLQDGDSLDSGPLVAGSYGVFEDEVDGWATQAVCSDGSDPAQIDLSPGEVVTCTFTNTAQDGGGDLQVSKRLTNVEPGFPATQFTICVSGPSFPLPDESCQPVVASGSTPGTVTWSGLVPGLYTVTEQDPGGDWEPPAVPPEPVLVPEGVLATAEVVNIFFVPGDARP